MVLMPSRKFETTPSDSIFDFIFKKSQNIWTQILFLGSLCFFIILFVLIFPLKIKLLFLCSLIMLYFFRSLKGFQTLLILYIFISLLFSYNFPIFKKQETIVITAGRLLLIFIICYWISLISLKKIKLKLLEKKIFVFLVILSIAQIICGLFSPTPQRNLSSAIAEIIEYYLIAVIVYSILQEKSLYEKAIKTIVIGSVIICLIASIEWILNVSIIDSIKVGAPVSQMSWPFLNLRRETFTFPHPIAFGMFVSMVLPWAIFLFFEEKKRLIRRNYFLAILVLIFSLLISFSRGPWLAGGIAFLYMMFKRKKQLVLWSFFGLLILILFSNSPIIKDTAFWGKRAIYFEEHQEGSVIGRITVIKNGIELIKEKPLIGWGMEYTRMEKILPLWMAGIENFWISMAIGKGLIITFLFIFLLIQLWLIFKRKKFIDEKIKIFNRAYIAFLIAFIINLTATGAMGGTMNFFWALTGIALAFNSDKKNSKFQNEIKINQ